jgi:hypothetical protein
MISHRVTRRPEKLATLVAGLKHRWMVPFRAFEWFWEWVAYALSHWSFLEVLEYLGSFSVLIGVIFYFSESGDRIKQRHYQAWQVINTAQGKGGSGGRIEALQELNEDKIPLVGVDVSSAFFRAETVLQHGPLYPNHEWQLRRGPHPYQTPRLGIGAQCALLTAFSSSVRLGG